MKQKIHYGLALLVFLSCTPDGKKDHSADLVGKVKHQEIAKKKFDLFNITFKQTLKDEGLNPKGERPSAETLEGYGTFVSSSPDILTLDHQALAGKTTAGKNQVVLHYTLNRQVISAFELQLYTSDALKKLDSVLINKVGQPSFTERSYTHPGLAIDKNGNMMDGPKTEITYQVWRNTKTGISYHLVRYTSSDKLYLAELTAINDKGSDADDWRKFKNYDKYKNTFIKDTSYD